MNRLFMGAALVATLFIVSLAHGGQTPPVDPNSADSVRVFALDWFEELD